MLAYMTCYRWLGHEARGAMDSGYFSDDQQPCVTSSTSTLNVIHHCICQDFDCTASHRVLSSLLFARRSHRWRAMGRSHRGTCAAIGFGGD